MDRPSRGSARSLSRPRTPPGAPPKVSWRTPRTASLPPASVAKPQRRHFQAQPDDADNFDDASTTASSLLPESPLAKGRTEACRHSGPTVRRRGLPVRVTMTVTCELAGLAARVELTEGEVTVALPGVLPAGTSTAEVRNAGAVVGTIRIAGAEVPFGVQAGRELHGERGNFVFQVHRQRGSCLSAGDLQQGAGTTVDGDGIYVEAQVTHGLFPDLTLKVRPAKKKELTRLAQERALRRAMEREKFSTLHAQITKSQMRKVDNALIEQARATLKNIERAPSSFLSHAQLKSQMKWRKVTAGGTEDVEEPCPTSSCSCNTGWAEGEQFEVLEGAVQQALEGMAPKDVPADEWLFKALVKAALNTPEGCVWKSGGKFLLTNEDRNQAASAICSVLEREPASAHAGMAIRALIAHTQVTYGFRVTAVQLNFHPNEQSHHKQHRDIYGAGQKGGLNCTCSFMKCVGTVCYAVGSPRQVLCETWTDSKSRYEACGEDCQGKKVYKWMPSGSCMMFNDAWNRQHTHGVPKVTEKCGPRISIALLCAPMTPDMMIAKKPEERGPDSPDKGAKTQDADSP